MFAQGDMLIRHRQGDGAAFGELVQHYRKQVYSYLIRCGVSPHDRDDLFQEVFLKLHRAAHTYDSAKPFEGWFYRVVCNTVRSYFRTQQNPPSTDIPDSGIIDAQHTAADQILEAKETIDWLEQAIKELPLAQREALLLCGIKDLSQADVAAALDIPVNTVKTNLRRARLSLASRLARRGGAQHREAS